MNPVPAYGRVLLKISGEALGGSAGRGLDFEVMKNVCRSIRTCTEMGVKVGVVTGGGNYWRGVKDGGGKMEEQTGVEARVMTNVDMPRVAESYCFGRAMHHLDKGRVVLFAGGSGNPYFSTDSAAALKAAEMHADILLMAKNIDGVYSADPKTDPKAVRIDAMSYDRILEEHLNVIDSTAACLLRDNAIPTMIFALDPPENIARVVCGERIGTIVR